MMRVCNACARARHGRCPEHAFKGFQSKPPELDHVVCCNPAKAMCGAFVAGQDVKLGGPEQAKNPCQECFNRAADGELCGALDCPGGEE